MDFLRDVGLRFLVLAVLSGFSDCNTPRVLPTGRGAPAKTGKTKNTQFSTGKRIIVFDAMDGVCLLIKLRKLVEVSSGLNMAGQAVTCPQEPDENG